jgi:hypothetical protein
MIWWPLTSISYRTLQTDGRCSFGTQTKVALQLVKYPLPELITLS